MFDLIVIGGGPAGLTATVYALKKRLSVMLVSKDLGGKANFYMSLPWSESYQVIRGQEIVSKFRTELEYLDFARHMEPVEKVERIETGFSVLTKGGGRLEAKAVIVATGLNVERLDVPGARDFMMRGIGYSALSYAPLFIDKKVIVIGDDELALHSTAELATNASQVTWVRNTTEPLKTALYPKLRIAHNVTVLEGYEPVAVKGEGFVNALVVKDSAGNQKEIETDGIFVEKRLSANAQMVADLVQLDAEGRIVVDNLCRTNVPGIFAAGDVASGFPEQILVAIGEGAKAALSAYEYLLLQL